MIPVVYGLQALVFVLCHKWDMVGWMGFYILAIPIFSFMLPIYLFWHMDDFSWGASCWLSLVIHVSIPLWDVPWLIHPVQDEGKFDPDPLLSRPGMTMYMCTFVLVCLADSYARKMSSGTKNRTIVLALGASCPVLQWWLCRILHHIIVWPQNILRAPQPITCPITVWCSSSWIPIRLQHALLGWPYATHEWHWPTPATGPLDHPQHTLTYRYPWLRRWTWPLAHPAKLISSVPARIFYRQPTSIQSWSARSTASSRSTLAWIWWPAKQQSMPPSTIHYLANRDMRMLSFFRLYDGWDIMDVHWFVDQTAYAPYSHLRVELSTSWPQTFICYHHISKHPAFSRFSTTLEISVSWLSFPLHWTCTTSLVFHCIIDS